MHYKRLNLNFVACMLQGVSVLSSFFFDSSYKRVVSDINVTNIDSEAIVSLDLYTQLYTLDCALLGVYQLYFLFTILCGFFAVYFALKPHAQIHHPKLQLLTKYLDNHPILNNSSKRIRYTISDTGWEEVFLIVRKCL